MVHTNKLNIQLNYTNFVNDFVVVKFSTTEKYIPNGAKFLDELPTKIKVKSIVFSGDLGERSLFALMLKREVEKINLRKELDAIDKGEVLSFEKLTTGKELQSIPIYILAQLLINSLSTPMINRYRFNNLSGYFFHFNTNNYELRKVNDVDTVIKIKALQIKINKNQELELNVKTFSSLYLYEQLGFTAKSPIAKYPKYTFSHSTNTLRRILTDENIGSIKTFIIKQEPNKKSTIPFINFSNLNELNASKIGALQSLKTKLKKSLKQYISISFDFIEDLSFIRYEDAIKREKKRIINEICSKSKLNIINEIEDEYSQDFLDKLKPYFKDFFGDRIKQSKKAIKNQLNVRLIHNIKHYEKYKITDMHHASNKYVLHNITFEDFKPKKASIENLIKELIIKNDIINNKVTVVDWEKYEFKDKWIFGIKDDEIYYFLTIEPDGKLIFEIFEPNLFNQTEFDTYCEIFDMNSNIEGIIINANGEINAIEKSAQYTIPDYETLTNTLSLENKKHEFSKTELIDFINETELDKNRKSDYIYTLKKDSRDKFSKTDILDLVTHRTDRKNVNEKIYEKTGVLIRAYLKGQDRYDILASNLDIASCKTENGLLYFVGTKGKGIRSQIPRASIIRKIVPIKQHPIFFNQLLALMNVDFVRNGDLTVKPFPFKYLNEWIEMNKK